MSEVCENCGGTIGKLETPYVWQEKVVCAGCHARLSWQPNVMPAQPAYAGPPPMQFYPQQKRWSPGVAAVLSFLIPGLGQIYKGQVINGLVWLVLVVIGYFCMVIPGLILHLICVAGAASGNPYK
jgi:TM2 domain-containing membrane protein YozV